MIQYIPSQHQTAKHPRPSAEVAEVAAALARWSASVERWEGFKGERHSTPARGAMKVMPLHRKGWGNCGLEPGNREELDRKPEPCDRGLWFSTSSRRQPVNE